MSKTNDIVAVRLEEVRMGEHERIRARAHYARAEAIADLIARGAEAVSRLFKGGRPSVRVGRESVSAG